MFTLLYDNTSYTKHRRSRKKLSENVIVYLLNWNILVKIGVLFVYEVSLLAFNNSRKLCMYFA